HGSIVLTGVSLLLDLDLHPDDPVIVLLEAGQLLFDVTAEPVGHLAVPSIDHNVHVDLPCLVRSLGAHANHPGGVVPGDERSPSGRPGLRPHNRLLRLSRLAATTPLLPPARLI